MTTLIIVLVVGAVCGGLWGRFGRGGPGETPSTNRWQRGALFGAVIGLVAYFAFGSTLRPYKTPENIKAISEAEFEAEVLQAGKPVVVDFYAPWCSPCKVLTPRLDKLAGEFGDRIKFVSVNVDDAPRLASQFDVQAIPALLFMDSNGEVAGRTLGLVSEKDLRAKLESLIQAKKSVSKDIGG